MNFLQGIVILAVLLSSLLLEAQTQVQSLIHSGAGTFFMFRML